VARGGRNLTVAVIQGSFSEKSAENISRVSKWVADAAKQGANIIAVPELFESPYFCKQQKDEWFASARPFEGNRTIEHFQNLAKSHSVVIPVSFFEKDGPCYYNSVAVIDADGSCLGVYRKSHIPDGPGYQEKFYFRPGNTGFKVWKTKYAVLGVGICWDQWFPECARAMVLMGAELLLYPTAIGSEPGLPELDTKSLWQRAMVGHAVSNVVPVIAANRIGDEEGQNFYGSSFICNEKGEMLQEMSRVDEGVAVDSFDLDAIQKSQAAFGFFRDRRPELYSSLFSH
jgi:N-carbamoylputrescine amidase